MSVIPIKGHFENPKAFLHQIAEDDQIEAFVMMVFRKDGEAEIAHINCKVRDFAFAGVAIANTSLNPPQDG